MTAANEQLSEIYNSIANDLTGADAQTSGVNPVKTNIIEKINDCQKDIVNSRDWTFMIDTVAIKGFTNTTTQATIVAGFYESAVAALRTQATASKTEYYAQRITTEDKLVKAISIPISLKIGETGAGVPVGAITLGVYADSGGSPDLDDQILTSDALTLALNGTFWASQTFLFTAETDVLLKNTNYWIVFKWVGAANNGDSMYVGVDVTTDTAATTLKTRLNNAATWTTQTGVMLTATLTYYESDYETTLTLPTDVSKIYRIYAGTASKPTTNLLPYSTTQYINSPDEVPMDKFVIRAMTDGALEVWINPATANNKDYTLEYKKVCTALSDDTDYPVIPRNYRALLKYGPLLYYVTMGLGMQDTGAIALLQARYDKLLRDLRAEFLPNPATRIGVSRRSMSQTSSPHGNYNPNAWSVK